jgi:Ankyrin repeats (3 copies)
MRWNIRGAPTTGAVVRVLLERRPESVRSTNDAGLTPLKLALKTKNHDTAVLAAVEGLAEAWPDSILVADEEGRLPLHVVSSWSVPWTAALVQRLVDLRGHALQVSDKQGKTPLHHAVQFSNDNAADSPTVEVIQFLVRKSPNLILETDSKGRLPLHIAAISQSRKAVRVLVELGGMPNFTLLTTTDSFHCMPAFQV